MNLKENNIEVVHIRSGCNYYCGRAKNYKPEYGVDMSVLGNPYWMNGETQRNEVCDRYDNYLSKKLNDTSGVQTKFIRAIDKLVSDYKAGVHIRLGCFCAPRRCHCDSIKNAVIARATNQNTDNKVNTKQFKLPESFNGSLSEFKELMPKHNK